MAKRTYTIGKLPLDVLERLLARAPILDRRVRVGPRVGVDAAVIDCGANCLVLKSDPITFAADRIGWYAVHVNANDIATMGARPRWLLVTALLPEGAATRRLVERIFDDLSEACRALGVSLCGGHTEVTGGLDRPILCGHMIGEVERRRLVVPDRVRVGDRVLLARGIAIEGTAVAAHERRAAVERALGTMMARRARQLLDRPGISVVKAALAANDAARVHAMHDPTEGGLAMGLYELARAARIGLAIDRDAIPILPETSALCGKFRLDPLKLLASGALVIVCAPKAVRVIRQALERDGVPVAEIGVVRPRRAGVTLAGKGRARKISSFSVDEIARFLAQRA